MTSFLSFKFLFSYFFLSGSSSTFSSFWIQSLNWNTSFPAVTVCEIFNGEKNWDLSERYQQFKTKVIVDMHRHNDKKLKKATFSLLFIDELNYTDTTEVIEIINWMILYQISLFSMENVMLVLYVKKKWFARPTSPIYLQR